MPVLFLITMVKKSVLRKLSNPELENYLKEGNRFTPEAVEMAAEVLEERGKSFSEQERAQVQQIIQHKKAQEELRIQEEHEIWKDHITDDPLAVKLFPRNIILIISFILGTIPGSLLLGLNFIKLKKYVPAIFTIIFGLVYLPVQHFLVSFLHTYIQNTSRLTRNPEVLTAGFGMLILLVLSIVFTPKKLPYRAASYTIPIIISVLMIIIIYVYQDLFSSYFLVNLAK